MPAGDGTKERTHSGPSSPVAGEQHGGTGQFVEDIWAGVTGGWWPNNMFGWGGESDEERMERERREREAWEARQREIQAAHDNKQRELMGDPGLTQQAYDYNDPDAMEDYYERYDKREAERAANSQKQRELWAQSAAGQAGGQFLELGMTGGEEDFWKNEEARAKNASTYKGQVPSGSMVVDGKLVPQLPVKDQPEQAPVQQMPMGNIGAGAPSMGQQSMQQAAPAPTVTPQGGTSATYSPLQGTQFKPNPYKTSTKREIPSYGGGNVGYGGGSSYSPKY